MGLLLGLAAGLCGAAGTPRVEPAGIEANRTYTVTSWSTKDGLPADRVRHLWQDMQGFMWIATFNGVARFDGVRFRSHDVSNTPGLANNLVNALYEDRGGNMWLGHDTGEITVWRDGRFQKLLLGPEWLGSPIDQFGETADGTVWARNRLSWLLPVSGLQPGSILKEVGGQRVSDIASGNSGQMWLSGDEGVFPLDSAAAGTRDLPKNLVIPYASGAPFPQVRPSGNTNLAMPMRWEGPAQVFRARQGGVWVADHTQVRRWADGRWTGESVATQVRQRTWTNTWMELADGRLAVSTYDEGLQFLTPSGAVQQLDAAHGLPADYVTALVEDREGNLWVGAGDKGLCRLRPSSIEMVGPPGGWGNWSVQTVIAARDGSVWAGTEGAGVYRLRNGTWTHLDRAAGLTNLTVKTMLEDSAGRIWAGLTNGDFGVFEEDRFRPKFTDQAVGPLTAVFQSRNGDLWIGGLLGVGRIASDRLTFLQPVNGQLTKISGFAEAADGTVWIASVGNGLGRYRDGVLQVLRQTEGLPSNYIWSLQIEPDDTLRIGTDDRGLVTYREGRFSQIDATCGIPGNKVAQIIKDESGALWLGTNGGIARVGRAELERHAAGGIARVSAQVYDESEGLITRGLSGGSQAGAGRTPDGLLWFATDRGLARIDPRISPPTAPLPPVLIETIRIDGIKVEATGLAKNLSLEVEPGSRRLEIDYTGLNLTAPHRVLFRYIVQGADENWNQAETRRTAYLSYLRPGRYVFRVQSLSAEGTGGPEAALQLNVKPHFWETNWFAALAVALTLGLVAGAVYWATHLRYRRQIARIEQMQAIERDRTRIAHDIHDEIGSGLTQLSILSHSAQAVETGERETTVRLREIEETVTEMTTAIDEIVWAVNPRHDSLESLVSYLSGVVQEFTRRVGLQCHINVPFDLERLEVTAEYRHDLYLVMREALHNVAKHAAATEVRFSVQCESDGFVFRLEDNGRGIPARTTEPKPEGPGGIGLESMRQRITKLGGTLTWANRAEGGTAVIFRVALRRRA
ncbi:MAG: two-component regulator propeller domain-containing protein [Lacunisphaera sp.]|nr:two-component regulator propeller domain-containing protein [Lacunisphaera sp.]